MRFLNLLLAIFLFAITANAQSVFTSGAGAPSSACTTGIITYQNETTGEYYDCVAGAWHLTTRNTGNQSTITTNITASFPSGMIMILISGTCPTGFTELTALNGKFILGTLAANGDIGTSGGSDNITPAGTVSAPTFTGNSVTSSAVSGGTPAGTNSAPTFTGNAVTAASTTTGTKLVTANTSTGVSTITTATGTVSAPVFTGSALATHTHTTTATGTNSAPSFTGSSFDNRPAFIKVIFCKKT